MATVLNNLALLYKSQGRYEKAKPLLQRALSIMEQSLGGTHLDVTIMLNNLASLYDNQGKYALAEPLYQRALHIQEEQLGPEHPDIAVTLNTLANLYREQGKYAEAEPLYQKALIIVQKSLGIHPLTVTCLENYVLLLQQTGRRKQAKELKQFIRRLQAALP